jgi:hypothetical protein
LIPGLEIESVDRGSEEKGPPLKAPYILIGFRGAETMR